MRCCLLVASQANCCCLQSHCTWSVRDGRKSQQYQSDCRMIHVTNLLELQAMLPRPFDAIVQQSRYNDGGISSDHHEKLLSCVWQGRRARKPERAVQSRWPEGQNRWAIVASFRIDRHEGRFIRICLQEVVHQSPQTNSHANTVSACSGIAIIVCRCKVST